MDDFQDKKKYETEIYQQWLDEKCFEPSYNFDKNFSICIPPPNVTGSLHMGHALNNTIQDILIRYHRMNGYNTLWQPGTDHAGIATQMVVERNLAEENIYRKDLTREQFIEKVWEWKEQSGSTIINQLKRLGSSADWSRERFTMDEGLSEAVRKVFVTLYKEGLIYKDQALVNWDTKFKTAISDLEVIQTDVSTKLYYIKYLSSNGQHITIATIRPETIFGDMAIAVNETDERFHSFKDTNFDVPLTDRKIPLIYDDYSDPEKGSGAVKITPAHDFNDFDVSKRHDLELLNILNEDGTLNENCPEGYAGLDRFEARKKIVKELKSLDLIEKIEDYKTTIPYGDRSNTVIEPYLTFQWYCNAKELAKDAISAVKTNKTEFFPSNWDKTYFQWMENIRPWCISRQIWWGHQIPIWYGPDGKEFCAETEELARAEAVDYYKADKIILKRDKDVLDTWFSSALWPFSTLGWPENNKVLENFYPNSVLVTGFDIIFFWVARMMMMGNKFMKETPFKTVYIHALVRDENGQKMSKSKGNVLDPLVLSEQYGADSLRFTLAAMAAQGRDIKLSEERIAGYRNFSTKIWNGCKFLEFNDCILDLNTNLNEIHLPVNKWTVYLHNQLNIKVKASIQDYKFNDAADVIYQFIWKDYCDWYIEFIKPILVNNNDQTSMIETRFVSINVMKNVLLMLHPIMPYVTEEIFEKLFKSPQLVISSAWLELMFKDLNLTNSIDLSIKLISEVRSLRVEKNIPLKSRPNLILKNVNLDKKQFISDNTDLITNLAKLDKITFSNIDNNQNDNFIVSTVDEITLMIPLEGLFDLELEKNRLNKELSNIKSEIEIINKRINNSNFINKAPSEIVEEVKKKQNIFIKKKEEIEKALFSL